VSCEAEPYVVDRAVPAHSTTEPLTKPPPFTVSVKLVFAFVEVGLIEEIEGVRTVKLTAFEVVLPGFTTVTE